MRYLKLYESFGDEFRKSLADLKREYESKKQELLNNLKRKVDEFMFDLTDDYSSGETDESYYTQDGDDHYANIVYNLKCNWSDFQKFLNILKDVNERIKSQDLEIYVDVQLWSDEYKEGGFYNITYSHLLWQFENGLKNNDLYKYVIITVSVTKRLQMYI